MWPQQAGCGPFLPGTPACRGDSGTWRTPARAHVSKWTRDTVHQKGAPPPRPAHLSPESVPVNSTRGPVGFVVTPLLRGPASSEPRALSEVVQSGPGLGTQPFLVPRGGGLLQSPHLHAAHVALGCVLVLGVGSAPQASCFSSSRINLTTSCCLPTYCNQSARIYHVPFKRELSKQGAILPRLGQGSFGGSENGRPLPRVPRVKAEGTHPLCGLASGY